ncbi:MAG: GIN domain-containing protein [Bacteroides sp.]
MRKVVHKVVLWIVGMFVLLQNIANANIVSSPLSQWQRYTYDLKDFDKIVLQMSAEVQIRQGSIFSIIAESGNKGVAISPALSVRNSTLIVTMPNCANKHIDDIKMWITLPRLSEITLQGSGDVILKEDFLADDFRIRIQGSGDVKIGNLNVRNHFSADIQGSGDLEFDEITAGSASLCVMGSGDILGRSLHLWGSVVSQIQGSGSVLLRYTKAEQIQLQLIGSSDFRMERIEFDELMNVEVSGSGSLTVREVHGNGKANIVLRGSGDVQLRALYVDLLEAQLVMSGDIVITQGNVRQVIAAVLGSGDMKMSRLACNVAYLRIQGSGNISLDVQDVLYTEKISGSGEIYFTGSPRVMVKK